MSKKFIIGALMIMTTPLLAQRQEVIQEIDAAKKNNYILDYAALCSNTQKKGIAREVYNGLSSALRSLLLSLQPARSEFSRKNNAFETETYTTIVNASTKLEDIIEKNADAFAKNCPDVK